MKLKVIILIGEILDEVTSWFNIWQIVLVIVVVGLITALMVPVVLA